MPALAEMPDMPPAVRLVKSGTELALMTVNTRLACVIPARGLPIPQHKLRRRVTSRVKSVTPAAQLNINGRKTLARASKPATVAERPAQRPVGAARSRNLIPVRNAATRRSISMILQTVPEATNSPAIPAEGSMTNVKEKLKPELFYIQI